MKSSCSFHLLVFIFTLAISFLNVAAQTTEPPSPATNAPPSTAPKFGPVILPDAAHAPPVVSTVPASPTPPPSQFIPDPIPNAVPNQGIPNQGISNPGIPNQGMQQQEDIDDVRPPFFFLHSHFWLWFWLWVAVGTLGLIALIIFLWDRFGPRRHISPKTAYELALEKLEKARALLLEENPVPYAVFISEAIRTYLGQRFQAPSTRRTTEEFLRQMEADSTTPLATHRDLLRDFLQSCDMVKFARYQPTRTELEEVQQRALTFVTATKPIPVSNQNNGRRL